MVTWQGVGIVMNNVEKRHLETGRLFEVACQGKVWELEFLLLLRTYSI